VHGILQAWVSYGFDSTMDAQRAYRTPSSYYSCQRRMLRIRYVTHCYVVVVRPEACGRLAFSMAAATTLLLGLPSSRNPRRSFPTRSTSIGYPFAQCATNSRFLPKMWIWGITARSRFVVERSVAQGFKAARELDEIAQMNKRATVELRKCSGKGLR
jgi:hypothetical protein